MSTETELEKKIDAYVKGKLSEDEAQELWKKLLLHPEYIDMLKMELGIKEIYDQGESADNNVRERGVIYSLKSNWKWIAAAASIAILVVAINFFQVSTNQPINELALNSINEASNLATAPVLRSGEGQMSVADSLLNKGYEAAIAGNIEEAQRLYEKIISEYPDHPTAIKANLNIGVIQYNNGNYKQSADSFSTVVDKSPDDSINREKAYWYLGNSYLRMEELQKARNAIYEAYILDGMYKESAHKLLQKIDYELKNNDAAQIN